MAIAQATINSPDSKTPYMYMCNGLNLVQKYFTSQQLTIKQKIITTSNIKITFQFLLYNATLKAGHHNTVKIKLCTKKMC